MLKNLFVISMVFFSLVNSAHGESTLFDWARDTFASGNLPTQTDFSNTQLLEGSSVYVNEPDTAVEKYALVYNENGSKYYFEYFKNSVTAQWDLSKFISTFLAQKQNFTAIETDESNHYFLAANTKGSYRIRESAGEAVNYLIAERVCEMPTGCKFPYNANGSVTHAYAYQEVVDYTYIEIKKP